MYSYLCARDRFGEIACVRQGVKETEMIGCGDANESMGIERRDGGVEQLSACRIGL